MKTYTDLEQSKKLAEILPIESADMHYNNVSIKGINYVDAHRAELMEYNRAIKVLSKYTINPLFEIIPCWSLTTLLNVIPGCEMRRTVENKWEVISLNDFKVVLQKGDNPIDACYELILKLHELNLL